MSQDLERQLTNEERYLAASGVRYEPLTQERIEHLLRDCECDGGDHSTDDLHRVLIMLANARRTIGFQEEESCNDLKNIGAALSENADLRAEVARLTAENERILNGNALLLSRNIDLSNQVKSLNRHHQKREAQYEQWLAERTQQLAAAEAKVAVIDETERLLKEHDLSAISFLWSGSRGFQCDVNDDDREPEDAFYVPSIIDGMKEFAGWIPQTTGEG